MVHIRKYYPLIFTLVITLATFVRFFGVDWDQGYHLHPDERFVTMVATEINWPQSFKEYLNPQLSPLSPFNTTYKSYIYGTFPLFLTKWVADIFNQGHYDGIHLVGRQLSALFDIATLGIIYLITRRLWSEGTALAAAAFYGVTVLAIQQSHFYTVDTFATFWLMTSLYLATLIVTKPRSTQWWQLAILTVTLGITFGFAIASKLSIVVFGSILVIAYGISWIADITQQPTKNTSTVFKTFLGYVPLGVILVLITYTTFRLTQPYAFATSNWLNFTPQPDFWRALEFQRQAIAGEIMFPPQYQWVGKMAYWFPYKNLTIWGMGLLLGVIGTLGIIWQGVHLLRVKNYIQDASLWTKLAQLLILVWVVGFFAYYGANFVKTMRYFLPILPLIPIFAAVFVRKVIHLKPIIGYSLLTITMVWSTAWAIAYLAIYQKSTTRVQASEWIYKNIPPHAQLAYEHWDDPLPLLLPGYNYFGGTYELEVYGPDIEKGIINYTKLEKLHSQLGNTDYLILSSPRASGTIGKLPNAFPMMVEFYKALDNGSLGFEKVKTIASYPTLFGITINDSAAEEAFWVYDHPPVRVYHKKSELTFDQFSRTLCTIPACTNE